MRTVTRLSVAPVKSTALIHPEEIRLERWGVPGNREFHFVDAGGKLLVAGRHGSLVVIRSEYDADREVLTLRLPSGEEIAGRVNGSGPEVVTDMWGRDVAGHVVEGPWADAVSRHLGEPVQLVRADEAGDGNDSHPVSMVSGGSIRELGRQAGAGEAVDSRRFRMLIEFDGATPHEEDQWLGCAVRVGETVVQVIRPDPRCVVTTQNPETGESDLATLKVLAIYRRRVAGAKIPMGVYANVVEPGRIRVGDQVEPLG